MAKLYFYYASMNAGKSTNLLQADFNYRERGMATMLWTAAVDTRQGAGAVSSRIGLAAGAHCFDGACDLHAGICATHAATPLRYVVAMIRHVLENLSEPLNAEDVAKVVGLHPNYALNLFTSVMNVPLHKFVVRMRLIRARSLLFESTLSIENVAFQSGFSALSQFYLQFRRAYGVTPRQMRSQFFAQA